MFARKNTCDNIIITYQVLYHNNIYNNTEDDISVTFYIIYIK